MVWQETAICILQPEGDVFESNALSEPSAMFYGEYIDFRELMPWSLADVYATLFYVHLPRFLGFFFLFFFL